MLNDIDIQKQSERNVGKEEWVSLEARLMAMNKKIFPIASDGHCLYRAILHQLSLLGVKDYEDDDVYDLRRKISEKLLENKNDLLPFMDEEYATDEGFERYCHNVRDTAEWGGEIELQICAKILQRRIEVFSGGNDTFVYGEEYGPEGCLFLAFHRELLAAGGHYNSMVPS